MGIGFQIISCPIGDEPTAVTVEDDHAMVIISEIPHLELDNSYVGEQFSKEIFCPDGHLFYVYIVPSDLISI